jgi:hypothetical protein
MLAEFFLTLVGNLRQVKDVEMSQSLSNVANARNNRV